MRPEILFPFIFLLMLVLAIVVVWRLVLPSLVRSIRRAWDEAGPTRM